MRFVAGRGAEAELLAGTPWLSAIGKLLLAGGAVSAEILLAWAPGRSAIGNMLLAGALLSRTALAEKTQGCIEKQQPAVRAQSSIGKH